MTDLIAVPREQLEPAGPCPVCGTKDRAIAYPPLPDRLCGTPGSWTLMRCAGCGLLIQDPRYTRENIGRAYENYSFHIGAEQSAADARPTDPMSRPYRAHAYGYDDGLPWWRRARAVMSVPRPEGAEAVGFSVMYLRPVPGGEVLDVGCGGGAFLTFMRSLGWRTLGVEPDRRAVEAP